MKVLFIGDIVGRPGRQSVHRWLPELRRERVIDVVVANAENAAGGMGATPETLRELSDAGVQAFTMGNHVWRKEAMARALEQMPNVIRPANYPPGAPGRGWVAIDLPCGRRLGLANVLGRVYMEALDCPFRAADAALEALRGEANCVIVDVHAEATSEKVALGWHLDGRCGAVLGTHTHVQTADEWVLPRGTAYMTDVGMCGPLHSVIGVERDRGDRTFPDGAAAQVGWWPRGRGSSTRRLWTLTTTRAARAASSACCGARTPERADPIAYAGDERTLSARPCISEASN